MNYLIDTNVVSEFTRKKPNANVIRWFDQIPSECLFISVLSLGEIRKGLDQVSEPSRKEFLRIWLEHELPAWFADRILPIDIQVCDCWGRLQASTKNVLPAIDSLIAATAIHHDLTVVSRNIRDFAHSSVNVINPWEYNL